MLSPRERPRRACQAGGVPCPALRGGGRRALARLAWVDKAPAILKEDAEKFLEWCQREELAPQMNSPSPEYPKAT